jgi:ribonuclease Z
VKASEITRICLTHFHGDHCLGLPGVIQRLSLDQVSHVVEACYPADGREIFARLRHAAIFRNATRLRERPVAGDGTIAEAQSFRIEARQLTHGVTAIGYRLVERDARRMVPAALAAHGIAGPQIRELQQQGHVLARGRRVTLEQVSEPRPGQRFAFIMDTRLCDAAFALADGADMVVCESTFLQADEALAASYGHLTAAQAGRIAGESGARTLVLTHFSARYPSSDSQRFADEAAAVFGGELVVAQDLSTIPLPRRR